jgi:hypothetical protein
MSDVHEINFVADDQPGGDACVELTNGRFVCGPSE